MGFDAEAAANALRASGNNVLIAANRLTSSD